MGKDKPRHYVEKGGRAYWQPSASAKAHGLKSICLGNSGVDAMARALELNAAWDRTRLGLEPGSRRVYPRGSLGEAFQRFQAMDAWSDKAVRTREEWHRAWRYIEPIFGDVDLSTVDLETIDKFYSHHLRSAGVREAHRIVKIWRALWRVAAAMGYCVRDADPSLAIRRRTPAPRSAIWSEGEVVRLVKTALRSGFPGLAGIIAVAWDTQFSPADARKLAPAHIVQHGPRTLFTLQRSKTGRAVIGTLSKRTERLVLAYVASLGAAPLRNAPIFRNRSGRAYSKDTLGDDFRTVRQIALPGDDRKLLDMRRSGAVEASAGDVDMNALAAKMGNTINQASDLQRTYQPVNMTSVRAADEARRKGRNRIRENG